MAGLLTIDEIVDLHYGEWVLMRVTEYDDDTWPRRGHVLAHSPRQEDLLPNLEREAAASNGSSQPRGGPFCSFRAYPTICSGPAYQADVTTFAAGLILGKASDE